MAKKKTEDSRAEETVTDRRSFMKLGATSVVGGAIGLVTGGAANATEAEEAETSDGLYKETAHIRKVYELARF